MILSLLSSFCSHLLCILLFFTFPLPLHISTPLTCSSHVITLLPGTAPFLSFSSFQLFILHCLPLSLLGPAPSRIANSVLTELVVLDTVPLSEESAVSQHSYLVLYCSFSFYFQCGCLFMHLPISPHIRKFNTSTHLPSFKKIFPSMNIRLLERLLSCPWGLYSLKPFTTFITKRAYRLCSNRSY